MPNTMSSRICSAGAPGLALSVEAARLKALAVTAPIARTEVLALDDALGRVLAAPPLACSAVPPFSSAAMDGFAVQLADLDGEPPWTLPITDQIAAGDTQLRSGLTGAARIFTGAPVPANADYVIQRELVQETAGRIILQNWPAVGKNIRRAGEDCAAGSVMLQKGHQLSPARLALLAATGCTDLEVFARLRVAILSTGDELVEPGNELQYGQIYNSNRVLLRASLTKSWIKLTDLGIAPDDFATIRSILKSTAILHDVIITSGGMSAGCEDYILDALIAEKAELDVLKVAIRPGKPLTVGRLGSCMFFGLPGNPLAAAVTFSQIAMPSLRKAAGMTEVPDTWVPGVADFNYQRAPGRREFIPVRWSQRDQVGRVVVEKLGNGSSAGLVPLGMAMGLAVIEPDQTVIRVGEALRVEPLTDL